MLHVEYECQLRNMNIPWGNIAHRLSQSSMLYSSLAGLSSDGLCPPVALNVEG